MWGVLEMEEIFTLSALEFISDDELDDVIMYSLLARGASESRGQKYGKFDFDELNEQECLSLFRFKKSDIEKLQRLLKIPDEINTSQRYSVSGLDGLCILLRRLAYPNRLADIEPLFGLSSPYLSVVCNCVLKIIYQNCGHLISDLRNLQWLTENRLQLYADSIAAKGSPIRNCWGFIDGTAQPICRPSNGQQEFVSGYKKKKYHCLKYQSIVCPDGIVTSMTGPFHDHRYDPNILQESNLYDQLEEKVKFVENKFVLYGDPAYPIKELLLCPFSSENITNSQAEFNEAMSSVRQAVEWVFGKVITEFASVDFVKNHKILLQDGGTMYKVGVLLTNCHTCLYGSQCSTYFDVNPVSLEEYLA